VFLIVHILEDIRSKYALFSTITLARLTGTIQVCDGVWGRADGQIGSYFHEIKYDFLRPTITEDHSRTHVHELDMPIDDFIFWVAGDLQILLEERDQG
jgi:hypothetical protein